MRTDDLVGAVWLPGDGKANPADITQALARGARSGGVRIFEKTRVTAIDTKDGRVTGVQTTEGPIKAEIVVNCGGQWARQLARTVGVTVPLYSCEHEEFAGRVRFTKPEMACNTLKTRVLASSGVWHGGCITVVSNTARIRFPGPPHIPPGTSNNRSTNAGGFGHRLHLFGGLRAVDSEIPSRLTAHRTPAYHFDRFQSEESVMTFAEAVAELRGKYPKADMSPSAIRGRSSERAGRVDFKKGKGGVYAGGTPTGPRCWCTTTTPSNASAAPSLPQTRIDRG